MERRKISIRSREYDIVEVKAEVYSHFGIHGEFLYLRKDGTSVCSRENFVVTHIPSGYRVTGLISKERCLEALDLYLTSVGVDWSLEHPLRDIGSNVKSYLRRIYDKFDPY